MSFKGQKNLYMCTACGHGVVSQDVDEGVTPFIIRCLNCGEAAQSFMYACPQPLLSRMPAAIQWFKPTPAEAAKESLQMREHLSRGGLKMRIMSHGVHSAELAKNGG